MPSPKTTFRFSAPLSEVKGAFVPTVIFLPPKIVSRLPAGRLRVAGTFNDVPFALAVQNMKDGARYFSVSAALRKAAHLRIGDIVKVSFTLVDPEKLDLPEEMEVVLAQDPEGKRAWDSLTTGYQRTLLHYITSAKNVDTRIQRCLKLVEQVRTGQRRGARKKE